MTPFFLLHLLYSVFEVWHPEKENVRMRFSWGFQTRALMLFPRYCTDKECASADLSNISSGHELILWQRTFLFFTFPLN